MIGTFEGDWPLISMQMTDWELKVENESDEIRSVSYIGVGPQGGDPFDVEITVMTPTPD